MPRHRAEHPGWDSESLEGRQKMVSISKRAASVGAAVAMIATAGPVAVAGAATVPVTPPAIAASLNVPAGPIPHNPYTPPPKAGDDPASSPSPAPPAAA